MIKLLIADDSAFMRKAISKIAEKDPKIKVIGFANNGQEAIDKIKELRPDVLTLDIEMPLLNGLEALRIIMKECPLPVLMISSLTKQGAAETLEALELGALDYIPKNLSYVSLDILKLEKDIIEKIKLIAKKKPRIRLAQRYKSPEIYKKDPGQYSGDYSLIAIGASTGGPGAVQDIITSLPADLPCPVVVAQHMPAGFTRSFAERLDSLSSIKVKEAENGENIQDATVYIAPGNHNMALLRRGARVTVSLNNKKAVSPYKPSVDVLVSSAARIYGKKVLGIILTGMGNDGLLGMRELKKNDGFIIAQDEETSIIYGMPKAVIDDSLADVISPLQNIIKEMMRVI